MSLSSFGCTLRDVGESARPGPDRLDGAERSPLEQRPFDEIVLDIVALEAQGRLGESLRLAGWLEHHVRDERSGWTPEIEWFFETAVAQALERSGAEARARRRHEAALGLAVEGGFEYGIGRSRLHLARLAANAGDLAGALEQITGLLEEPNAPAKLSTADPELAGLASAELGHLLVKLRAGTQAVRYLQTGLEAIPRPRRRTRAAVLHDLVDAALDTDELEVATGAFTHLKALMSVTSSGPSDLLRTAQAAILVATGEPGAALSVLDDLTVPTTGRAMRAVAVRLGALNSLGRYREAVDSVGPDDPIDEQVALRLAEAHEGLGQLPEAFEFEKRAAVLRSECSIGMTAMLPVIDDMAISGLLTGVSQQLTAWSARQDRDSGRFNELTGSLLADLRAKVNALGVLARRVENSLDPTTVNEIGLRARHLADVLVVFDQRPRQLPDPNGVNSGDVLERLCRTVEPVAAQRRVRLDHGVEPGGVEPGGWQYYSTWRRMVAASVSAAPAGSVVKARANGPDLAITVVRSL